MDGVWEIKVQHGEEPLSASLAMKCAFVHCSHIPLASWNGVPRWRQSQKTCKSQETDKFVITFWKWLSQVFKITCYSCFVMRGEKWYLHKWEKPLRKNWKTWELSASSQQTSVDDNKEVYLDFQKAFNKISHQRDQYCRIYYGILPTWIA